MDVDDAKRIVEKLKSRYPDAQVVHTGGGFVNVYWTEDMGGELRSFVLGEEDGSFGVDTYAGDYMADEDALFLWPTPFEDMGEDEVIAELVGADLTCRDHREAVRGQRSGSWSQTANNQDWA